MPTLLHIVGYASGNGSDDPRSCMAPIQIQESLTVQQARIPHQWVDTLYPRDNLNKLVALDTITDINSRLATHIHQLTGQRQRFCTLGGDHSCAIGTWSGAASAIEGPLGLIWIDAHMDAHTPESSHSHNIHGMPVASLLGHGPQALTQILSTEPKLSPEHIHMFGMRSFEPAEQALLDKLGVHYYLMPTIHQQGLHVLLDNAVTAMLQAGATQLGISIDIDGFDPEDAPAVDSAVADGIKARDFLNWLPKLVERPQFIGLEIAEFNPPLDQHNRTEQLILELLHAATACNNH